MAFMMPVMKNDYNIYKSNRNRRVSECSNDKTSGSSASSCAARRAHGGSRSADGPSLSTSPGSEYLSGASPAHRSLGAVSSRPSSAAFQHHNHGKSSSRNSQTSLQSPAKSSSSSSPPKLSSTSSLNLFHSKLVDKLRRSLTSKSKDNSTSTTTSKDIARRRS